MSEFDWSTAPTICELNGYRWVLGPEAEGRMNWDDATEWCDSVGGNIPPRDVLFLAYLNDDFVGGFAIDNYWSSSENNSNNAWYQAFGNGRHRCTSKSYTYLVRAVRTIKLGEE